MAAALGRLVGQALLLGLLEQPGLDFVDRHHAAHAAIRVAQEWHAARVDMNARRAALRRAVLRRRRLLKDEVLWRVEAAWVRALDRRGPITVDPATGRTPRTHLEQRGEAHELWSKALAAIARGADSAELMSKIHEAVDAIGAETADTLRRTSPAMLRDHRWRQRGFDRRLQAVWGPALAAFYVVYVCMEELGSDLQQIYRDSEDDLTDALLGLQARAALVVYEVHQLLSAGLPLAAWARVRTLHETAVIAEVLGEHGREPGTDDLATRYLAHAIIEQAGDLKLAAAKGVHVDPQLVVDVEASRQQLLGQYGDAFAREYGWARPLFPNLTPRQRVSFVQLELLAATGLSRFDYRVGSHHVHASAYTLHLNRQRRGNIDFRLTGPINIGLDGPVSVALPAALLTSSAVVYGMEELPPHPTHLLALSALRELAWAVEPLLNEAAREMERREERVQQRPGPENWRGRRTPS